MSIVAERKNAAEDQEKNMIIICERPGGDVTPAIAAKEVDRTNGHYDNIMIIIDTDQYNTKKDDAAKFYIKCSDGAKSRIEVYEYYRLTIDWPTCQIAMPHTIVGDDIDDLKVINEYGMAIPTINYNDIACLWIGARAGNILRIEQVTGNISYRRVVLPPGWR